ncbi:hypothetical protein DRJ19_01360 [Candidatus Woesearchaeota archaeon]|nr:MAG: hypothetical protein DRJ19_01360 [Candidatus Woesearchaeota archaeon]
MPKNTYRKGLRTLRKTIKWLEDKGCIVGKVERVTKYGKTKDLFGLFDLIAIKDGKVFFVQAASNKPHSHKPILDFVTKHKINAMQIIFEDRKKEPRVYTYSLFAETIY